MKTKLAHYLYRGPCGIPSAADFLCATDSDPNCNRHGAQSAANEYRTPVGVYRVRNGEYDLLYVVQPQAPRES